MAKQKVQTKIDRTSDDDELWWTIHTLNKTLWSNEDNFYQFTESVEWNEKEKWEDRENKKMCTVLQFSERKSHGILGARRLYTKTSRFLSLNLWHAYYCSADIKLSGQIEATRWRNYLNESATYASCKICVSHNHQRLRSHVQNCFSRCLFTLASSVSKFTNCRINI